MATAPKIRTRDCRLIVDQPARGSWNMALDEALLESTAAEQQWTLRFYSWSQPTLSLGYFQPAASRQHHEPSRDCDLVRRSTGGGAILHDRELTYSITLPTAAHDRGHLDWLYYAFHETLIDTLHSFGVSAQLQPRGQPDTGGETPFLCFLRRTRGDVLLSASPKAHAWKIAGSAQRRSRGAVLQHGSVLLQTSESAPDLLGVEQVTGCIIQPQQLCEAWRPRLCERLHLRLEAATPTDKERARAEQIEAEKFAHASWTERR